MTLETADPVLAGESATRQAEGYFGVHYLAIMRVCLRQLGDRNDAEDATQETFRRAIQQRDCMTGDPLPWLLTVARNVCIDELRRRRNGRGALERAGGAQPDHVEGEGNPEGVVVGRLFVGELLERLTPAERRVIARRVLIGESGAEASAAMGVTASTARVLLARAKDKLRRYVNDTHGLLGLAGFTCWRAAHGLRRRVLGRSFVLQGRAELLLPALVASAMLGGQGAAAVAGPVDGTIERTVAHRLNPDPAEHMGGSVAAAAPTLQQAPPTAMQPWAGGLASPAGPSAPSVGLLPPPDPYKVGVTDFEPSPNYSTDHTILMVGEGDCYIACNQLYRSTDGGATWTYTPTQGLQSTRLLIPASTYPGGRFYAAGGNLLQLTTDGGASFHNASPTGRFAAVAPPWLGARVLSADLALWLVGSSQAPQALAAFPPSTMAQSDPVILQSPGGFVVLLAVENQLTGGQDTLLRCTAAGCAAAAQIPLAGRVQLIPSPTYDVDHTLAAIGGGVAISHDGGASFQPASSEPVFDATLTAGPNGLRMVAVDPALGGSSDYALGYSDDLGHTWHGATMAAAAHATPYVRSPRLIAPGQLIASAGDARHPGLYVFVCSGDGALWSTCR